MASGLSQNVLSWALESATALNRLMLLMPATASLACSIHSHPSAARAHGNPAPAAEVLLLCPRLYSHPGPPFFLNFLSWAIPFGTTRLFTATKLLNAMTLKHASNITVRLLQFKFRNQSSNSKQRCSNANPCCNHDMSGDQLSPNLQPLPLSFSSGDP